MDMRSERAIFITQPLQLLLIKTLQATVLRAGLGRINWIEKWRRVPMEKRPFLRTHNVPVPSQLP